MNDRDRSPRRGVSVKLVAALVLIALLVVFWAQNRARVHIHFLFVAHAARVWMALLISGVVGFIAGFLVRGDGND
jgi:uncharacterized integral membrane protein